VASPIAHALAGYLISRVIPCARQHEGWTIAGLCSFLAVSPDLDFLPGLLQGQPALYHQGISHSLGFAVLVSLLVAFFYGGGRATWSLGGLFFLAYGSHLIIDVLGPDTRPPYGIPLFWPLSEQHYLAPFQLFRGFHHAEATSDSTGAWASNIMDLYNVGTIVIELAVFLPFILILQYRGRRILLRGGTDSHQ